MQVKSRIFPYPVLNNNSFISNYKDIEFNLEYEEEDTDNYLLLKNIHFVTNSAYLLELFENEKIDVVCIVECSSTVYRKSFKINDKPGTDITIAKNEVFDKVYISMFAYALDSIIYKSSEFDDDYQGIDFEIEKYDIVAANDGYYYSIQHDEKEDSLAHSIFSIIIDREKESGVYSAEYDSSKKIVISLSEEDYNNYKIIHTVPIYKEVFFNMLLVPTLTEALTKCHENIKNDQSIEDVEDITNTYLWFKSILNGYKKLFGKEMKKEEFLEQPPIYWAQTFLGKPLGISLNTLVKEMKKIKGDENEND